jgi:protein TonB
MNRDSLERFPALAAAIALHVGVIAAILMFGNVLNKPVYGPNVVSVTLVNTPNNPSPSIVTPTPSQTAAPPTPEEAPAPLPPAPVPKPVQAAPKPTPAPSPKPVPTPKAAPAPTPKPVAKPAPDDSSFPDKILNHIGGSPAQSHPRPPSNTASGTGATPSPAAMASLKNQLERLWNPNCEVMGGSDISIVITFQLGAGGRLSNKPTSSVGDSGGELTKVASDRAIRAVYQYFSDPNRPFANLPPDKYTVNFNPKEYCSQR